MATVIMARRKAEGGPIEPMHEEGEHGPALLSCAEDLISAVHMKDANKVAEALKSAFEVMGSEPHEETGDEDASNEG